MHVCVYACMCVCMCVCVQSEGGARFSFFSVASSSTVDSTYVILSKFKAEVKAMSSLGGVMWEGHL